MRQMLLKAALLVATLGVFLVVGAGQALASHVNCGDTITQDTKLDSDLLNCPANGIVIGADNITLDLNGHVIDGSGFPPGPSNGVDNSGGYDGVTVENGTIQDFRYAVEFQHVDNSAVSQISIHDVLEGVRLFFSHSNEVRGNAIVALGNGIALGDDAQSNLVILNTVTDSGNGIALGPLTTTSPPQPPELNRVERNILSGNHNGVELHVGLRNTIERNAVTSNTEVGIEVNAGALNAVSDNDLTANGLGIAVDGQQRSATVVRNRVEDSSGDGIQVGPIVLGTTLVERNVSNHNGDDGIDVDTTRALITKNQANFNADLGIEAIPGVTDGGGNKARGNGTSAQCLNVQCK